MILCADCVHCVVAWRSFYGTNWLRGSGKSLFSWVYKHLGLTTMVGYADSLSRGLLQRSLFANDAQYLNSSYIRTQKDKQ
jgi:hypothetical protein